jgi:hypothetical protein
MKRRSISLDGFFDIECGDWTTFVIGAIRSGGTTKIYRWTKEEEMARVLADFNGTMWAHAGGIYDFKWLLDWFVKLGVEVEVICAGSRIVMLKTEGGVFCDSFALVPMSLKKFTASQSISKQELALPCVCGNDCGGYCSISRTMPFAQLRQLQQYLVADCESLDLAMHSLKEFAEDNDLDLGPTVGGSAWRCVARTTEGIPRQLTDVQKSIYPLIRPAYFGGRVEVYQFGVHETAYEYDVNSSYPYSLTQDLPIGVPKRVFGADARKAFDVQRPGLYQASVDTRGDHIPRFPVRTKARVVYPADRFVGFWALPEFAGKEKQVTAIHSAVIYERHDKVLAPWFERLFELRRKGDPKSPLGVWLKFYMNSLSGKLGMKPERTKIYIHPDDITFCKHLVTCYPYCNGDCGAMYEISDCVFGAKQYTLSDCAHIEWASYLTARSRVILNEQQMRASNGRAMIYSDTDSVISSVPLTWNIGDGLGQFKFEGELRNFEAFAPKVYQATKLDGKLKVRAKGVRIAERDGSAKTQLRIGEIYRDDAGVVGVREGTKPVTPEGRAVFFRRKDVSRRLQRRAGGRIITSHGQTRPPTFSELEDL